MLDLIMIVIALILSIPAGYWIAWLCRDELVIGRRWFRLIISVSILLAVIFFLLGNYSVALTMLVVFIVTLISLRKSFDKSWTNRRID